MNYTTFNLENRGSCFSTFAERECKGVSPIYEQLSLFIAQDDALLDIAGYCKKGQPIPNLFLAAVHYLLLQNPTVELATYYPSIYPKAVAPPPESLFKSFCLENKEAIKSILETNIVQTNAPNRSAYLLPVIAATLEEKWPIVLVEIGTSAGLMLNLEQYEYHFNGHHTLGHSPVKIKTQIREGVMPPPKNKVRIHKKIGIDQHPLDVKIAENANWLKALIWPDQTDRFQRLEAAIQIAQESDIQLIQAQEIADFERIILAQDPNLPLVVFHTHVLYQFSKENRLLFWDMLDRVAQKRDFYYIAAEHSVVLANDYGYSGIIVEQNIYRQGQRSSKLMAKTNGHADWVVFQDSSTI